MKTFLLCIALTLLVSLSVVAGCNQALAQENEATTDASIDWSSLTIDPGAVEVGDSLIAPNSSLYFLKSIREHFELLLSPNDTVRAQKELEFAVRRLREVKSLIEIKRDDLIESTLEKYRHNINGIRKVYGNNPDVGGSLARHMFVLETFYPQTSHPGARRAIRSSIIKVWQFNQDLLNHVTDLQAKQTLLENLELRQIAACKFFAQESRASDLNATEREFLKQMVSNCEKSIREDFK